jgi:hypothetical protein
MGLCQGKRAYLYFNTPKLKEVFLSKTNSFSKGNNVLHALASNTDGFLLRDTCVTSINWKGLFGTTWALLHLQNYDLHGVFIETHSSDKEECDR